MDDVIILKVESGVARTPEQLVTRIGQIDAIIDYLLSTALESIATGGVAKYRLNTGQTQQDVEYKSTDDVMMAVKKFESLREYYEARCGSRIVRLMDEKNFRKNNR